MGKWEMVKLGDIGKFQFGGTPSRTNNSYFCGKIPWITTTALKGEAILEKDIAAFISNEAVEESATKIVPPFSLMIGTRVGIGKVGINLVDMCTSQDIVSLVQVDESIWDKQYILKYIVSKREVLLSQARGATIQGIKSSSLTSLKIPFPPLDEQKCIAKNLGIASEIVKGYKEQLAQLDKLVQSVFYEMFGDPVINEKGWIRQSLLDFGSCKNGMNFGANENGIEIKYLGVGDFKELSIIDGVDSLSTISLMQTPNKEYLLRDEDIIFVRSNGNKNLVGRCVVVYPGNAALTFSGFCIRFRKSSDKLMTIYLLYVLKCASVRRQLLGRGANIQNLNQQILKQLTIPVPSVSLQSQFIEIVTEIEAQKTQVQQALTEAENLFNSLMKEYFE